MTGAWFGQYFYADGRPPVRFIANLAEPDGGGSFAGEVSEPNHIAGTTPTLHAIVRGSRSGAEFRFTKQYDGESDAAHAVGYYGAIEADGAEAAGEWALAEERGRFRMTRAVLTDEERADELAVTRGADTAR
jgi:hypothetical protein